MSRGQTFEIDNLDKWTEWLEGLESRHLREFKSRVLRTAGLRTLEYVDDLTPRRTGRLQNSASVGDRDNVFEIKVGRRVTYIAVGTTVEYAEAVEEGFTQRRGRYIPGYWRGGTFHYDPAARTGMVLTGKVVEGAHMYRKALDNLTDDMDRIVEFEFRRLYGALFRG